MQSTISFYVGESFSIIENMTIVRCNFHIQLYEKYNINYFSNNKYYLCSVFTHDVYYIGNMLRRIYEPFLKKNT